MKTLSPSYEWMIEGNIVGSGATLNLVSAGAASSDTFAAFGTSEGVWSCEVSPYDENTGIASLYMNGSLEESIARGSALVYTTDSEPMGVGSMCRDIRYG